MEKVTELGTIKISDYAFEKMIREGLVLTNGRDNLAPGRKNIIIEVSEKGLLLEFHVVHKFGTSMLFSSMTVLDYIESGLRELNLGMPVKIVMRVVAIKARRTVKRDHEIVRTIN